MTCSPLTSQTHSFHVVCHNFCPVSCPQDNSTCQSNRRSKEVMLTAHVFGGSTVRQDLCPIELLLGWVKRLIWEDDDPTFVPLVIQQALKWEACLCRRWHRCLLGRRLHILELCNVSFHAVHWVFHVSTNNLFVDAPIASVRSNLRIALLSPSLCPCPCCFLSPCPCYLFPYLCSCHLCPSPCVSWRARTVAYLVNIGASTNRCVMIAQEMFLLTLSRTRASAVPTEQLCPCTFFRLCPSQLATLRSALLTFSIAVPEPQCFCFIGVMHRWHDTECRFLRQHHLHQIQVSRDLDLFCVQACRVHRSSRETVVTSLHQRREGVPSTHGTQNQRTNSATMLINVLCTCVKRARQFSLATFYPRNRWVMKCLTCLTSEKTESSSEEDWCRNQYKLLSCGSEISTTLTESLSRNVWCCLWSRCQTRSRSNRQCDRQMCASWQSPNAQDFFLRENISSSNVAIVVNNAFLPSFDVSGFISHVRDKICLSCLSIDLIPSNSPRNFHQLKEKSKTMKNTILGKTMQNIFGKKHKPNLKSLTLQKKSETWFLIICGT